MCSNMLGRRRISLRRRPTLRPLHQLIHWMRCDSTRATRHSKQTSDRRARRQADNGDESAAHFDATAYCFMQLFWLIRIHTSGTLKHPDERCANSRAATTLARVAHTSAPRRRRMCLRHSPSAISLLVAGVTNQFTRSFSKTTASTKMHCGVSWPTEGQCWKKRQW